MNPSDHSEVDIETLPPMIVGSYRAISPTPEHDSTNYILAWLAESNLKNNDTRIFGFDVEVTTEDSQAGKRGYEIWASVPAGTQASDGVKLEAFQGGLYATLTLHRPFEDAFRTIPSGWKRLHEWVIRSEQYQGAQHQWLEEKLDYEDGSDLKLYHPIVAKKKVNGLIR